MTTSLEDVIFPHLSQFKQEQIISIDFSFLGEQGFNNSERVALATGFKKKKSILDKFFYVKDLSEYTWDSSKENLTPIAEERLLLVKKQLYETSKVLNKIYTEFDMSYNRELLEKYEEFDILEGTAYQLDELKTGIEELWWKLKYSQNNGFLG